MAKWMDSAIEAMKVREQALQGQLAELRKHIREAEAARGGKSAQTRKRGRVDSLVEALQAMGEATKDDIANHLGEPGKAHSIDQTMRNHPDVFTKRRDGRVNRWSLKAKQK